jgi:hypothetical protein
MTLLPQHERYIKRAFFSNRHSTKLWTESLEQYVTGHVPYDCNAGTFKSLENDLFKQLVYRVCLIPPRGNNTSGMAMVMLCCHLAEICSIQDAAAFRIVCSVYDWQSQGRPLLQPPVNSLNSFRVIKNRLIGLAPAA